MLFLLGLLSCLPHFVFVFLFFKRSDTAGAWNWARTVGWLCLWTLPAVVVQFAFHAAGRSTTTFDFGELFSMLPWSWSVLSGGFSVQALFEQTAKAVSGHRQSTMLDNWPYYMVLTWLQFSLVAAYCALMRDPVRRFRDRPAILSGVVLLINALLGITWPWWGS